MMNKTRILLLLVCVGLSCNSIYAQFGNSNVSLRFTQLELRPNVVDNTGRQMLQCWFSFSATGVTNHVLQPFMTIEIPQGTYHHYANGAEMIYAGQQYKCNYVGVNQISNAWLAFYNDALNPLPGKNTYYARIYVKDVTTNQIIGQSNYLTFTNVGEQQSQDVVSQSSNSGNERKSRTNLYQDNIISAHRGDAEAQALVGVAYFMGDGIDINYTDGFSWSKKSADQGFAKGQHNVGLCYENGMGVSKDLSRAVYWYRKASEQGFPNAQFDLGRCLLNGIGTVQDDKEAVVWLSKAAEQGIADAQGLLGHCYFKGLGIQQNQTTAVHWFQKAVDQGHVASQAYLGYCYYTGQGIVQDKEKGESLIKMAANQGDKEAVEAMNHIKEDKERELADANRTPPVDVDINIPSTTNADYNTFAVIIGNEKYRNVDEVPFAENDARVFREYVEKTFGVPERQIMYVENAGYNDIRQAVNWLNQAMQVCRGEGKAIFYYAGHGIPSEKDQTAYLLPVDGVGNDVGSAYSLKQLYENLGSIESQSVKIFLDACFSGSKRENGMLVSARGVAIKAKPNAPIGNMVVFSAAQGDETAYPYKEKKHGMFTYYLLKNLQATKGNTTLGKLGDYLVEEVGRQSFVENKKTQTPCVSASVALENWKYLKLK